MRAVLRIWVMLVCLTGAAAAQDDDKGIIVDFLEEQLSGAGRDIQIRGFTGALSSRATIDELTIADEDGIWLTLRGAVLEWNRRALFAGRVEIAELSAAELILPRLPPAGASDETPSAEATPFRLPDLPVSIEIGKLGIARAEFGAPVMGEDVAARLSGKLSLTGDQGDVAIVLERVDTKTGRVAVTGNFDNTTNLLELDLQFAEAAGGLGSRLMGIPGEPALDARIAGRGPLDDFAASIILASDGAERLAGTVTVTGRASGATGFAADLGGDITALFAPEYRAFFGPNVKLVATGQQSADGTLTLDQMQVAGAFLSLNGSVVLAPGGVPEAFAFDGEIRDTSGAPVLLPGTDVTVGEGILVARYDAARNNGWTATIAADQVTAQGARIGALDLDGGGTISPPGEPIAVTANLTFQAAGLALDDTALQAALGETITGAAGIAWSEDTPLTLSGLSLNGADYGVTLAGQAVIDDRALQVDGRIGADMQDLSRLSQLLGQELRGSVTASLDGSGDPLGGVFEGSVDIAGTGLGTGIAQLDPLIRDGVRFVGGASRGPYGLTLNDMAVTATGLTARLNGRVQTGSGDIELTAALDDIARVLPDYTGAVSLSGRAFEQGDTGWNVDMTVAAPYNAKATISGLVNPGTTKIALSVVAPDLASIVPGVTGSADVRGNLTELGEGRYAFAIQGTGPFDTTGTVSGQAGGLAPITVEFDAALPRIDAVVPGLVGAATVKGSAIEADGGRWRVDVDATGPYAVEAAVQGVVGATASRVTFSARVPDVAAVAPGLSGSTTVSGTAREAGDGRWDVAINGNGPYRAEYSLAGLVGAVGSDVALNVALPDVSPLAPGYRGPFSAKGTAKDAGDNRFAIGLQVAAPYGVNARVGGVVGATGTNVDIAAEIPNIGALVPGVSGLVTAAGSVQQAGDGFAVDIRSNGPGSAFATTKGTVSSDGSRADLAISGTAPLALGNRLLAPRAAFGEARFDLKVNGAPGLEAVSGQITTNNGRLTLPTFKKTLNDITSAITLSRGAASVDVTAGFSDGGTVRVTGPVRLTGSPSADLTIALQQIGLKEPALLESSIDGSIRFNGPLAGGARIDGALTLGLTEIRIPETGLSFGGDIPAITHINEPRAVRISRQRGGILSAAEQARQQSNSSSAAYPIDLVINAPSRIFIRGRGLDAELGGQLRLSGTTADLRPIGQFELVRGRLDLLGKRLSLDEGLIAMAGNFSPTIELVARAVSSGITAVVTIAGPVTDPDITFSSEPELPEDEVLARLFFGKSIESLSPLQAAQMAVALRTLSGRGGGGALSRLRSGFGLDDLDVSTDESGNTAVRAGAYISDNAYTDVTTNSAGDTEVNLNIDLTDTLTIKGSADNSGSTSIGIFFERDY